MSEAVKGIEPAAVWFYFEELSRIPRESGNEAAFRSYLIDFAEKIGLEWKSDPIGNVVIRKPASKGFEQAASTVIQGHMDMVCVKSADSVHDFTRDPIRLVRREAWMHADGTTLGADNGIAVAMALAVFADPDAQHGPLEALFTVSEETGLIGALELDISMVSSRRLINLDSEEEGVFIIGCAGGSEVVGRLDAELVPVPAGYVARKVVLSGFLGGHSGSEIHTGRGNALLYGMRFFRELEEISGLEPMLVTLSSGSKRNVIPSTFTSTFVFAGGQGREATADEAAGRLAAAVRRELAGKDPDAAVRLLPAELPEEAVSAGQTAKIIAALYLTPHGPSAWSSDIEGLVETSNNLASASLDGTRFVFVTSQRSSLASAREELALRTRTAIEISGARTEVLNVYPSWPPASSSPFALACAESYRRHTGSDPVVTAIHAGLECGVLNSKADGMESISFGPDIRGAHSFEERVHIESVERVYNFLMRLLVDLARGDLEAL